MQLTAWIIPPMISVVLCAAAATHHRRSYPRAAASALQWMMVWTGLWCAAQAASLAFSGLSAQVWFSKLQYPGVLGASFCWLIFALVHTGRNASPVLRRILISISALITALVLSNDSHGLIWSEVYQVDLRGLTGLAIEHGPFFYLHALFCYALVVAASAVLALQPRGGRLTSGQWVAILGAPSLVVVATIFYLSPQAEGVWLDFVPTSYAVAGALLGRALLDRSRTELAPIAHSVVFESLNDVVFVLDGEGRVVDLNRAARRLLGMRPPPGAVLADLLEAPHLQTALEMRIAEIEDVTLHVAPDRMFDVSVSGIQQDDSTASGSVLIFRDTTDRNRIETGLRLVTDELEEENQQLERLAHTDPLTDLSNRRHFLLALEGEIQRGLRHGHGFCLMLLDLDHFKRINDDFGHPTGDEVLVAVARTLKAVAREVDFIGRIGGEEFAVLLPATDLSGAKALAERLRVRVGRIRHRDPQGQPFEVTVSIGVVSWSVGSDPSTLLRAADAALYAAKKGGRNRVVSSDGVGSNLP